MYNISHTAYNVRNILNYIIIHFLIISSFDDSHFYSNRLLMGCAIMFVQTFCIDYIKISERLILQKVYPILQAKVCTNTFSNKELIKIIILMCMYKCYWYTLHILY